LASVKALQTHTRTCPTPLDLDRLGVQVDIAAVQATKLLGPSRWLFVVVDFNETPARIVTAYANRKDPSRSTQ
jgi:hypothetical protein